MSDSKSLFDKAKSLIPGGVNSPVRAFSSVGGTPVFFEKAKGAYLYSTEGKKYLDFVMTWGPSILGHAHPKVVEAVKEQAEDGFSFGMPSELEVELAEYVVNKINGIDMIRFVSSGTEATMSAIRLARGYTGKDALIKFEGCYHGHSDGLLVKAGSGTATFGTSSSAGVPEGYANSTIPVPFNNLDAVKEAFSNHEIAAVILEPVPGNMGVVPADKEFLQGLRDLCTANNAVLIFDEVMCGFRVSETTAADLYGIYPDLFCFGKVIGGGLPVGAFGGKKEIMEKLAPAGPVYQAGTLSGNPLAMRGGLETLKVFYETNAFERISTISDYLNDMMQKIVKNRDDVQFTCLGSMFTLFFHNKNEPINNFDDVGECDFDRFGRFFNFMLERGILLPPSQYEANFLGTAHTKDHIDHYLQGVTDFLNGGN